MKFLCVLLLSAISFGTTAQNIQLHYDMRHTVDPKNNAANFPSLYFEYFKNFDTGRSATQVGPFLLKLQADLMGQDKNIGKAYVQVSQAFRLWQPKIYVNLQYSGGLGLTEPRQYSYYIQNNFLAGINYPFRWNKTYLSAVLSYKYVPYPTASHDPMLTLYWWKGVSNYKASLLGDFSAWTESKNHGDDLTKTLTGKRLYFFAEPQFWYSLNKVLETGIKLNMYYHVIKDDNTLQAYPALAIKCKL